MAARRKQERPGEPDPAPLSERLADASLDDYAFPPFSETEPGPDTPRRHYKEKKRKTVLREQREARLQKEAQVVALALSGLSLRAIADNMGISPAYVHKLYHSHVDQFAGRTSSDFRNLNHARLDRLLQAGWGDALSSSSKTESGVVQAARANARRFVLQVIAEINKMEDIGRPDEGGIDINVNLHGEVSPSAAFSIVARIQAANVFAGSAEMPALAPPQTNGHSANGHGPAAA